jgi:TctA family transporter
VEQQFRRAILTAVVASIVVGLLLAIALGVASGKFFVSLLDLVQQAAFLAILFFSFFGGAALGARARDIWKRREPQQAYVVTAIAFASAGGFVALLYMVGFGDFGLFNHPGNRNSLLFAAAAGLGVSLGFFKGYT